MQVCKKKSRRIKTGLLALVFRAALPGIGWAQAPYTEHTLQFGEDGVSPPARIEDMAWLAGRWMGPGFGGTFEEVWAPPFGGTMMGAFKLVQDENIVFYEFMTLVEEAGSITMKLKHFNPDLVGWEEKDKMVTFRLVKMTESAVYFEGITFLREDEDTVRFFFASKQGDQPVQEDELIYRRQTN